MAYYGENEPHFLDACYLCRKPLDHNSDIFMYRGNTPFCSNECRQEQIDLDESIVHLKQKKNKNKNNNKVLQIESNSNYEDSSTTTTPAPVRTETVVAVA